MADLLLSSTPPAFFVAAPGAAAFFFVSAGAAAFVVWAGAPAFGVASCAARRPHNPSATTATAANPMYRQRCMILVSNLLGFSDPMDRQRPSVFVGRRDDRRVPGEHLPDRSCVRGLSARG